MTHAVYHTSDSFLALGLENADVVDVIITDPPYSPHVHENLCSGSLVGTKSVPKYELPFAPLKDYAWLEDAVAVTKRWVISFCDVEAFGLIRAAVPDAYVRGALWYKHNAMGQLTRDRPATAYEGIACLHRPAPPKKQWNGKGSYGIWRCSGTRGKKNRHPNEKPLDLCLKLVALFSNRGEIVFDPFCGSGAIGEACVLLGRDYVGWDSSAEWVEKARARLAGVPVPGGTPDEYALSLCTMPKAVEPAGEEDEEAA